MAFPDAARAAPALAGSDPCKSVCFGRLTAQDNPTGTFLQAGRIAKPIVDEAVRASIARLRDRHRFDFARLDVILAGLDSGILTSDVAAELAGVSTFPPEFAETAREWRARKYGALA